MRDGEQVVHWIDGQWISTGEPGQSINPASGASLGRYVLAGPHEADLAIAAALRAFGDTPWKSDRALRARVLHRIADAFDARAEEMAELIAAENGKIIPQARIESYSCSATFRFNAALALTEHGRAAQTDPDGLSIVIRQPAGVAGVIAPWNAPLALTVRSLAPALAAGATVAVMLPAQSAQVAGLICRILKGIEELPTGVVNVLIGGPDAGNALVVSPDVPVISFTGSTRTGRLISANAAPQLKRLGLELGGKTPMVVFDDADLDAVVPALARGITLFAGQFCMAGSRLIVQRGIADRLRSALAERLAAVKVGPASDPASEMGPLIDKANVARVDAMVADAIASGAEAVVRGGPATEGDLQAGSFYRPTLLEITDSKLPIVQQEVFGPVLTLQRFETEAEAIALANDSEYGLSASVWSRDVDRPLRIAMALEAGTVWINQWAVLSDQFEEGGFKQSGQGRMRGSAVMDDFLEYKHIALNHGAGAAP